MAQLDWVEWHRDYDDPGSLLSRRGNSCRGTCAPSSCGIFGNITDRDVQATVAALPSLCAPGALTLAIRSWFGEAGERSEPDVSRRDTPGPECPGG